MSRGIWVPRVNVLGVGISALNMDLACRVLEDWLDRRRGRGYVCVVNVHSVVECQRDPALRTILNQSLLSTPDGMPLVWVAHRRGFRHVGRVYGPDLMLTLCERSVQKGYRHYFYGGARGVPERLAARLQARFPGLQVVGTCSPPFRPLTPEEDREVVRQINEADPDIVWVGLGAPKQERWMAEHVRKLKAPLLIGVGAAFDFHAGLKPQAPRWMQERGLEWLFRLLTEPRRLWRRYLVCIPWFLAAIAAQEIGLRRYALDYR